MTLPLGDVLEQAARYGRQYRSRERAPHPSADANELRRLFGLGLPERGRDPSAVIRDLIRAAEPGLVGNTEPGFFAWVMGGSHLAGVAADWLTSAWGQNAAIYQTSPAAAIAEETAAVWLLDLLDLPRESSIGFTTGATMASFIGLAAARGEVLRRAGCEIEAEGLQGAPEVQVFVSDEAHASNFAALRFLGFGERNIQRVRTDGQGVLDPRCLEAAMSAKAGPKIVVCQAGHINSGAFDPFERIADLAAERGAWMHVDGAFGLWARTVPELRAHCRGVERADSWAVDGHKWLQLPYDSGFAIVRHADAHRRAMDITASYLTEDPRDGRNPTQFGPELSRRARGFAAWAMLQTLGREGVAEIVRRHHACARLIAARLSGVPGIRIENDVRLNQVVLSFRQFADDPQADRLTEEMAARLNGTGRFFLRTARWRGGTVLRISVTAPTTTPEVAEEIAAAIEAEWQILKRWETRYGPSGGKLTPA